MRHVGHEIIPYRLAGRMQRRVRLHVRRHVKRSGGESDDGRVVFDDELVLGEAFDVEEEIWRERV